MFLREGGGSLKVKVRLKNYVVAIKILPQKSNEKK